MFEQNLIEYCKTGQIGNCPNCGSKLTVEKYETPIRDNLLIKCPSCNKEGYFTGATKL